MIWRPSFRFTATLPLWPLVLLAVILLSLGGCAPKKVAGTSDPFVAVGGGESEKESAMSPVILPEDDGVPLSAAEKAALMSLGELDQGLSADDMRDVVLHFKSLVHGGGRLTVERNIERSRFFMPHIRQVMREEKLPQELAYLAFVESGYNPLARSRSGALGMWQFIPSIGKMYGMDQDWWMDERRDPYLATKAAAAYLSKLYGLFNDWHLAITAYNAGEGKISRGLAATGAKNFFELRRRNTSIPDPKDRLLDENQQYLPRFIAVCKIMRNLESLGFPPANEAQSLQVVRLEARPSTDLLALCGSAGLTWEEFSAHNPALQRYISHPSRSTPVYVPARAEAGARGFLSQPKAGAGWRQYKIARGDTMVKISRKTGIPVAELRRLNQRSEPLRAGNSLRIPGYVGASTYVASRDNDDDDAPAARRTARTPAPQRTADTGKTPEKAAPRTAPAPAVASGSASHTVAAGDTLYSIARAYNVKLDDLVDVNGLKNNNLRLGQQLRLPGGAQAAPKAVEAEKAVAAAPVRPAPETKTVAASEKKAAPASGTKGATAPESKAAPASGTKGATATEKTVAAAPAKNPAPAKDSTEAKGRVMQYKVQEGDSLWAIARKFNVSPVDLLALNNMTRDARLRPGDTVRVAVN